MSSNEKTSLITKLENALESVIFGSRWILAFFYILLTFSLVALLAKFFQNAIEFFMHFWQADEHEFVISILQLIDLTLMSNLMILVIFSGYENFVSVIGVAQDNPDRPKWMGGVDFAGLKLKLIGSLVALSSLNLLAAFYEVGIKTDRELGWMVGIHLTFIVTGVLFALSEKIAHGNKHE